MPFSAKPKKKRVHALFCPIIKIVLFFNGTENTGNRGLKSAHCGANFFQSKNICLLPTFLGSLGLKNGSNVLTEAYQSSKVLNGAHLSILKIISGAYNSEASKVIK